MKTLWPVPERAWEGRNWVHAWAADMIAMLGTHGRSDEGASRRSGVVMELQRTGSLRSAGMASMCFKV